MRRLQTLADLIEDARLIRMVGRTVALTEEQFDDRCTEIVIIERGCPPCHWHYPEVYTVWAVH